MTNNLARTLLLETEAGKNAGVPNANKGSGNPDSR